MLLSVSKDGKSGLTGTFSVCQGRWIDLLLYQLEFSVTCTPVTLKMLTGIHGKGYILH